MPYSERLRQPSSHSERRPTLGFARSSRTQPRRGSRVSNLSCRLTSHRWPADRCRVGLSRRKISQGRYSRALGWCDAKRICRMHPKWTLSGRVLYDRGRRYRQLPAARRLVLSFKGLQRRVNSPDIVQDGWQSGQCVGEFHRRNQMGSVAGRQEPHEGSLSRIGLGRPCSAALPRERLWPPANGI